MKFVNLRECTNKLSGGLQSWAYSYFDYTLLEKSQSKGMGVTHGGKILAHSGQTARDLLDSRFLLEGWLDWEHYDGIGTLPGFWIIRKNSTPNSAYIMLYWGAERWVKYEARCAS